VKTALICGVSGQDGSYLAKLLLNKGYRVVGASRDAQMNSFSNLKTLGIETRIDRVSMNLTDFRSVIQTMKKYKPDEIYNLAGQSSVGLSFEQPMETMESITVGTLNLLESIRFSDFETKLYNAGSGECFGDTGSSAADESSPMRPKSPYAVAKAAAYWACANYRESYDLFACTGLLFNHESPLRPEHFVTAKIIAAAVRIANGKQDSLSLGNIDIKRDWGWAPKYVEAMWLMLQQSKAEDFVIATGQNNSLREFASMAFGRLDLEWERYVVSEKTLFRPSDIAANRGNPAKAIKGLNWSPEYSLDEIIGFMIDAKLLGNNKPPTA